MSFEEQKTSRPATAPADPPASLPLEYQHASWWFQKLLVPFTLLLCGILLIVLTGVAQRIGWLGPSAFEPRATLETHQQTFMCPMHPQIRQPVPGRCPICGMALVPVAGAGSADLDELSVMIEPARRRLANIQTTPARREPMVSTVETIGAIAIDESRMATVAAYVEGRIERLFADYTGVDVATNDHLAVIYSPELYTAQVEYIESMRGLGNAATSLGALRQAQESLRDNSRQRLVELGMQAAQIETLEQSGSAKSRLTIYTPIGGTVIEKLAVEGNYVKAGEPIYRIADLTTVWLMLELYPEDAARIRFGQRVVAQLQSLPGDVLNGRVAFIDPTVNPQKRTVGVRVEFLNQDRKLRPGDYASAVIHVPIGDRGEVYDAELAGRWISPMHPQIIQDDPGECPICGMRLVPTSRYGYALAPVEQPKSLYVPRSAVLMAGNNSVVYVESEPGRFEIRPVKLGPILRDKVIILGGLREGEQVATSGNFLIDSQMQLAGKPSLIDPSRALSRKAVRGEPLKFERVPIQPVSGEPGKMLEALFAVYFRVQQSLAGDQVPLEEDATTLHRLARRLQNDESLPQEARAQLVTIARHSEHLHHMTLDRARHEAFRPISHAAVTLATQARGAEAATAFHHMFCPMVTDGGGDWLQDNKKLVNPYWGSEMLHCGENVQRIPHASPVESHPGDETHDHGTHSHPGSHQ